MLSRFCRENGSSFPHSRTNRKDGFHLQFLILRVVVINEDGENDADVVDSTLGMLPRG